MVILEMDKLKVKKFVEEACVPVKAHADDAGYDLASVEDVVIPPGEWKLVSTGLGFTVPKGTYGRVAPRSGVSTKGISINAGVIDRAYTGIVKCLMVNHGELPYEVKKGDRICQLILEKIVCDCEVELVDELHATDRGSRGFGSSGI